MSKQHLPFISAFAALILIAFSAQATPVSGSIDSSFVLHTNEVNNWVWAVVVQPDGKILIAGDFTSVHGVPRNRIARLLSDGSLDTSFDPGSGADTTVNCMALQSDGKILIGGSFSSINGTSRSHFARLNSNGSLDTGFS